MAVAVAPDRSIARFLAEYGVAHALRECSFTLGESNDHRVVILDDNDRGALHQVHDEVIHMIPKIQGAITMTTTKTLQAPPSPNHAQTPRTPARLRTELRAGGLLDQPMPSPHETPRGWDGEPLPPWWV